MPDESQSSSQNLNSSSSGNQTDGASQTQASSYQKNDFPDRQKPFVKKPFDSFGAQKPSDNFNQSIDKSTDSSPQDSPKLKKGFVPLGDQPSFSPSLNSDKSQDLSEPDVKKSDAFNDQIKKDDQDNFNKNPFISSPDLNAKVPKKPFTTDTANDNFSPSLESSKPEAENEKSGLTDWQSQPAQPESNYQEKPLGEPAVVESGPAMSTGSLPDMEIDSKQPDEKQSLVEQAQAITGGSVRSGAGLKKILIFLVVLLVLAGLIWSVFKFVLPRFQKPKEVTLTYWGLWEPETVMKGVIADWEKANPNIKINYLQQSPKEYRERLQSALARNEGPDIFRYHLTWLPMLKNELEPLPSEVMSVSKYESTFYTVAKENLRSGTSYVGVPLGIDTLALFYNQEIFQAAGKTPPSSWDELRQTAIDLTTRDESGRIQTAGVALGTTSNVDHWSDILGLMMLQNGVNLANPTGSLAQDALTYYTIFNTTDRVWDETLPASTLAFASGKVAMYFGYSWDIFEIKKINPNLDFKVMVVPQLPDTQTTWASFWAEGVAKKSGASKEAWQFLDYLSSKEVLQKLYQAQSQTRLFGEIYPRSDMANLLADNPLVIPFVNQIVQAKTWYLCSRTFDNGINDRMIKYFEDAVNAVNSGKSSTDVLETTAQGVSQLLSQYGLGSYVVR